MLIQSRLAGRLANELLAATSRLSIVHLSAPAPFGGLESVVRSLSAGQVARGHRVHVVAVVTPLKGVHPFVAELQTAGVPVTQLELPARAYREERRRILEICRAHRADVVHTHGYRSDVFDSGVAHTLGVPRVSTVHGFCGGSLRNRIYEWLQVKALTRFDGVIAVSIPQVDRLTAEGVDPRRIHLLPNAWAPDESLDRNEARAAMGIDGAPLHLGWVGRLSPEKGADIFIEALARLSDLPVVASIIGDGPQREALIARAEALGLGERLRWHGSLAAAGRFFPAFDGFVLSSRTEGTPMVLFEAMAARTPIVATAVGGVPHVVSAGEALLVPPEIPVALAAAIRLLHADPAAACARADRAHARLENEFGAAAWLDKHDDIYRQLVNATHRNR